MGHPCERRAKRTEPHYHRKLRTAHFHKTYCMRVGKKAGLLLAKPEETSKLAGLEFGANMLCATVVKQTAGGWGLLSCICFTYAYVYIKYTYTYVYAFEYIDISQSLHIYKYIHSM